MHHRAEQIELFASVLTDMVGQNVTIISEGNGLKPYTGKLITKRTKKSGDCLAKDWWGIKPKSNRPEFLVDAACVTSITEDNVIRIY